ncbi:hypothetical protein ACHAXH_000571 [Discostella pseudostelligera]|jgi:hypothetical protein
MVNNSNPTFFAQLIIWTTANGISTVSVWALLYAILRSPKVRSNSFNLYLVFCLAPDAYKNLAGFCANLANLVMDTGSPKACTVIGWNDAYWWCASLWMSFSVFVQIYRMLMANKRARRYIPPTMKRVTIDSVIIHVISIIMATFTVIPADALPKATPNSGCEAYPASGNRAQLIFYWVFFMPVTALIPTVLVTLLCFHIWWKDLLPRQNAKSRSLLFYFARLLATIYLVIIAVVISYAFDSTGNWVQAIAFTIFNLIGLFQVILALFKKDVRNVFLETWCCQKNVHDSTTTSHDHDHQEEVKSPVKRLSVRSIEMVQTMLGQSMRVKRENGATFNGEDEDNKMIRFEDEVDSGRVAKVEDVDVEVNESVRNKADQVDLGEVAKEEDVDVEVNESVRTEADEVDVAAKC